MMSKTNYPKKFAYSGLSFKMTSLSLEDNNKSKSDFKISIKAKDSWRFYSNLKSMKNLKRNKSLENIQLLFSPNRNNLNYIPISNKYSIIKFNKAHTLRENKNEIRRMIKRRKLEKEEYFNNIHNTILINESKKFRSNIYITGGGINSIRSNSQSIILDRNQNSDFLPKKKKYISHLDNNSSSLENPNINVDTRFNSNLLNNESNCLNDTKKNSDRSQTLYPLVNNFSNNNYIPNINIKKNQDENLISFIGKGNDNKKNIQDITKMRMELNDLIFNNDYKLRGEFTELEKKINKYKIIQNNQDLELKKSLIKEENYFDKKIDKLKEFKKQLENEYIKYSERMNLYQDFLSMKIKEMKKELKSLEKNIEGKYIEIEKISLDIIKIQNILESLVDKRNFLLQIKEKYKSPKSSYEELLIKDSKKLYVGNLLFSLDILKHTSNKIVIDFLKSVTEIKEKINEKILNIDNIKPDLYISNTFLKKETKPIFDSVEDFIHLYNFLKDKSINYLKRAEIEKMTISKMKKEFEDNYFNMKDHLGEEILEKEIQRNNIIHKNKVLIDTYNYYKNNILKKINDVAVKQISIKNKIDQKRFINIENDLGEKYSKELKMYKYGGILLLKKLIKLIKFYSIFNYDNSSYYLNIFDDKKLEIVLNVDINDFNDNNITLIDRYRLLLVSKYEKICKYILNKHQIYLLDDKNKQIIKDKRYEINNLRRLQISNEIKNLVKKKKNQEINKIIEKSNKAIEYIPNRLNYDGHFKKNRLQQINKEKITSYNKKHYMEKEFNDFTKYNEDIL